MASSIAINISANGLPQVQAAFGAVISSASSMSNRLRGLSAITFKRLESGLGSIDEKLGQIQGRKFDNIRRNLDSLNGFGDAILGAGLKGSFALAGVAGAALKASANVESINVGLKSFLGSADAAKKMREEIQAFANVSPFDFTGAARSAQKLLASGFTAPEIKPVLYSVGNAVSAGGGGSEEFQGVLTALGQIRTAGKLTKEDLNQITERNIPANRILQEQLHLTAAQVADIGSQGITSEKAVNALLKGMAEIGGGDAMKTQSLTLGGEFSTMMDAAEQLAAAVGDTLAPDIKALIEQITTLLGTMTDWVKANPDAVKGIFNITKNVGMAALAVGGLSKAFSIGGRGLNWIGETTSKFKTLKDVLHGNASAKDLLKLATDKEADSEVRKTGIAKAEGDALEETGGIVDSLKDKVTELGQDKFQTLIDDPKTALADWKTKLSGAVTQAKALYARPLALGGTQLKMLGGGNLTMGGAALGAGLGAVAGFQAQNSYSALGYSDAQSIGAGIATGVGAGMVAMFVPGGAVAVAAGEAVAWGINKYYNEPAEKAAEQGSGFSDSQMKENLSKTPAELSAEYKALAQQKRDEGDETSARSYELQAQVELRRGKRLAEEKRKADELAALKQAAEDRKKEAERQRTGYINATAGNTDYQNYLVKNGLANPDGTARKPGSAARGEGAALAPGSVPVNLSRDRAGVIRLTGEIAPSKLENDLRRYNNLH